MLWGITAITFLATFGILAALVYAFAPGGAGIAGRLSKLMSPPAPVDDSTFADKQKERVRNSLASLGKLVPGDAQQAPRTQLLMMRAGFRSPEAIMAMRGFKVVLPIVLVALVYLSGVYRWNPVLFPLIAGILGLPDALDLLVICVESGLGLDQALMKVTQEVRITHPELSDELQLVNLEMRIGKTRIEALRELARRTGLEDIKSLVAMLVQTDRFGTSVAQSLRVFSDDLRIKRRQRAEEMSAKTSVKMVFPLVFFIFPALLAVILGPAALTLLRQLVPSLGR